MKTSGKLYVKAVTMFFTIVCLGTKGFSTTNRNHFPVNHAGKAAEQDLQAVIYLPFADQPKLRVYVFNPNEKEVFIRITNDADVDFVITSKDTNFVKQFDLSKINDGWYRVEVSAGREKVIKTVRISTIFRDERQLSVD